MRIRIPPPIKVGSGSEENTRILISALVAVFIVLRCNSSNLLNTIEKLDPDPTFYKSWVRIRPKYPDRDPELFSVSRLNCAEV